MNHYIICIPYYSLYKSNLKYLIEKKSGTGSFGTIYEVLGEDDNKIYALKELKNMDTVFKQRFEREVTIW